MQQVVRHAALTIGDRRLHLVRRARATRPRDALRNARQLRDRTRRLHQRAARILVPRVKRRIAVPLLRRSEEHTSELQSLMRISYAVFCLTKNKHKYTTQSTINTYQLTRR